MKQVSRVDLVNVLSLPTCLTGVIWLVYYALKTHLTSGQVFAILYLIILLLFLSISLILSPIILSIDLNHICIQRIFAKEMIDTKLIAKIESQRTSFNTYIWLHMVSPPVSKHLRIATNGFFDGDELVRAMIESVKLSSSNAIIDEKLLKKYGLLPYGIFEDHGS